MAVKKKSTKKLVKKKTATKKKIVKKFSVTELKQAAAQLGSKGGKAKARNDKNRKKKPPTKSRGLGYF